jgi:hypothetical protein
MLRIRMAARDASSSAGAGTGRGAGAGAVAAMALATPGALGIETLARVLFLPPELEALRQELRAPLTPFAWGLLILTAAAVPLGFATRRAVERRLIAKVDSFGGGEKKRAEARFEALFVAASIPQIPAVFATLTLTFGADPLPVLIAVALSVAGVVAIAAVRV